MTDNRVRVRIAPSPTGAMHLGLARTALYNYLFARQHNGAFILRIDDTDQLRNQTEMLEPIFEGLRWLGLDWDEGPGKGGPYEPYYQSQRTRIYQRAIEKLISNGAAYLDYATPEEVMAERESARKKGETFRYSRRWMAETTEQRAKFEAEGRKPVVRLKMPQFGKMVIDDLIRGPVEFDLILEQDHIIQRQDGTFLYHLTSAVDDGEMKISHIIRAEEHLSNTPRQVFILQALGYPLPRFAHLPFVAEPGSKSKLSKRRLKEYLKKPEFKDLMVRGETIVRRLNLKTVPELFNPVVVDFYQKIGFLPEALLNYLVLLGWALDDRTEDFTKEGLVQLFSLEKVNRAPASFDPQKLLSFQVRYLMRKPVAERTKLMLPYLIKTRLVQEPVAPEIEAMVQAIVEAAGDRIKVSGDILDYDYFFLPDDQLTLDEKAVQRWIAPERQKVLLNEFLVALNENITFTRPVIEGIVVQLAAATGVKPMAVSQAVRVALTGRDYGFALADCALILGQERVRNRIRRALTMVLED
ncbi:MAG: glutamate--tRNA ligase [bacterium]